MRVYTVFQSDPGEHGYAEHKIEKRLVGDRENDESWREGEEDDDESM
jgi:hypothetical protein